MAGRGTPATRLLERDGAAHELHAYEPGEGSYGVAGAAALQVAPARMFKTLIVELDGRLACAVVPVSGLLDLKALAAALGGKRAGMADPVAAERSTGYVVGGISPFGQRTRLLTAVDETVELFDTVLVSAGRRGLSIELAPADLVRLTAAVVAGLVRVANQ